MHKLTIILLLALTLSIAGCASEFTRLLRTPDAETRIEAAFAYYDKEDYARAGLILEDLLPNIVGNKSSEKVQFHYAYCHYYQSQFELSTHYFKSFYDVYRQSIHAQEAYFMYGYSLYRNTPAFFLDQSNTNKAIDAMQEFLNEYPKSEFAPQATEVIHVLRVKLEQKAYQICKQYLKLRYYKAAVISLDNFQKDFPDSDYKEEISYLKLNAQYDLAKLSIHNVKKERFEKAMEYYRYFIDKYPDSKYIQRAEQTFANCQKGIISLNN